MANNFKSIEDAESVISVLIKVIKAQQAFLLSYRTGKRPPQWAFDDLEKARKIGVDC